MGGIPGISIFVTWGNFSPYLKIGCARGAVHQGSNGAWERTKYQVPNKTAQSKL